MSFLDTVLVFVVGICAGCAICCCVSAFWMTDMGLLVAITATVICVAALVYLILTIRDEMDRD